MLKHRQKQIIIVLIAVVILALSATYRVQEVAAAAQSGYSIHKYAGNSSFSTYINPEDKLYATGRNSRGQLGIGALTENKYLVPNHILDNVKMVSVGKDEFAMAIKNDGALYMWGSDTYAVSGAGKTFNDNATTNYIAFPTEVVFPSSHDITNISAGARHVLALDSDGQVWAWGSNGFGQLGLNLETGRKIVKGTPTAIDKMLFGGEDVLSITTSDFASFALTVSGDVYAWGDNDYGQLGIGNETTTYISTVPVKISTLVDIVSISAFATNCMALSESGRAYIWGNNIMRQIGDPSVDEEKIIVSSPHEISRFYDISGSHIENVVVKQIACGGITNFILDDDGNVYSFGQAGTGYVGFDVENIESENHPSILNNKVIAPTKVTFYQPIDVYELKQSGATDSQLEALPVGNEKIDVVVSKIIGTSGIRTFIMDTEGRTWSWGDNSDAMVCSGNTASAYKPVLSTLFRVSDYDRDIATKNYLIKPLIITIVILAIGALGIVYLEIKNRKAFLQERQAKKAAKIEKKEKRLLQK